MSNVLTLGEMVDLALGTPEVGCVNYNALHTVLHGIIAVLRISEAPVQLGQFAAKFQETTEDQQPLRSDVEEFGPWIGSQPSLADSADDRAFKDGGSGTSIGAGSHGSKAEVDKELGGSSGGGGKEKTAGGGKEKKAGGLAEKGGAGKSGAEKGGADKVVPGKGSPGEKGRRESGKATGGEVSRGRKSSGGKGRVSSPGIAGSPPMMVLSTPFHELVRKVEKLEESWKDLNEMTRIDPFKNVKDEKGAPLHDMWETLQFQKRLDANTEGVDKLMALVQEILHRLQKLAESDEEQMALITGSHQKIEGLAPKSAFDAVKQELNSIVGKVDSLHGTEGLVSWDELETALTGTDALRSKGQDGADVSHGSMDQGGSLKDAEESELDLANREEDDVEGGEGGAGKKGGASGKSGKDKQKQDGGKEGSKGQGTGKDGGTESGKREGGGGTTGSGGKEGGKREGGGGATGSGGKEGEKREGGGGITGSGGSDDAGSRRSSGGSTKLGPSSDLQTVLGVLGKLDDKFKNLLGKVSGIENNLAQKGTFGLTADTMKRMSDSAITIETTRDMMREFSDELAFSYLEPMKNATDIVAKLKDTAECSLPPGPAEEDYKLTGRKALALGALEKSMKLIDRTFGVLQRAVQNLDCKLTNQTTKWDERLSNLPDGLSRPGTGSRNLISSASTEDEACKDEEPDEPIQADVDNQTRLKELEKKLGLRKDEMCKMTKRLNQLNKAVSQQLHDAKDRLNDLESRVADMTCDLKRVIQKFDSDKGEYVVPTAAVLDGSGVSLLVGVQRALDDLRADMEKLAGKTDSLQENNSKHQDSIQDLLKYASDLEEKKTDKAELIEKAAKQDLDLKLDSRVFEATCDDMTKNINALLAQVARLDEECKNSFDKLTGDMGGCMTADEFDRIRDCMAKQFKVLAKKMAKMQKQLEIAKLVGDDAAGIRRQLFKCLSCDRSILMASQDPKPSLPSRDGLFPYRSTKPYTTYELEQIRQHARCFQIPKGLSNYERAVIERQLSRFKLRDLRGNANPYWKQDRPSSTLKHIRTSVSPNSQGDAAAAVDDPFPDPYACTRPCGGSHTLTSPYKRVIHMADLSTIITNEEHDANQQNQENYQINTCQAMRGAKSPVVSSEASKSPAVSAKSPVVTSEASKSPVVSGEEAEGREETVSLDQDKSHMESIPKSESETVDESETSIHPPPTAVAANSVLKQTSDDSSGRRFSDPTMINNVAGKKPDLKKTTAKVLPNDRRTSAPNASSSAGSTPNTATHQLKKRRYSTPVSLLMHETSSQSTHLKKFMKEQHVKEEDNKEDEETAKDTHKDNSET